MSPNISILLRVLGKWGDDAALAALRPLSDSEWIDLVRESKRLLVAPLLYQRLKSLEGVCQPPLLVMNQLRGSYLKNSARGVWFINELSKIVKVLHQEHIPVILYKGACLAGELYHDMGLRPMVDADILVHEVDYLKTQRCIDEMQESQIEPYPHIDVKQHPAGIATLHRVDVDGIWARARIVNISGMEVLALAPEDMFLTLIMHHYFQHAGQLSIGIRIFCDLSAVLDQYANTMDWELVTHRADEWGVSNCVSLALRLTRELLNISVPSQLAEFILKHDPGEALQAFAAEYFSVKQSETLTLSPYLLQLLGRGSLRSKLSFALRVAIPRAEVMANKKQTTKYSARFFIGYVLNAARLVWLGLKMLITVFTPNIRKRKLMKLIRWMS